jgi:RNA polymerase sigma-32 factor
LLQSIAKLNEREQFIVKNRMLTDNPLTLDDIGNRFNISRERVRQIEKRAFEKLSLEVKNMMHVA